MPPTPPVHGPGDPIASDVGHGAPGLRDNLRPFDELVLESQCQKDAWITLRGGKMLSGWSSDTTAGVFVIAWNEVWLGVLRDVLAVRTPAESLVRVETLALCRATEGTYFFDADQLDSGARWDDGTTWDSGATWDRGPLLYVHLTGGGDPDDTFVQASVGFFIGTDSVVHPTFGPEKLTDPGLEAWASASNLTSWTEGTFGTGGAAAVAQDAGFDGSGAYSAKIAGALSAGGGVGISQAGMAAVSGKWYRAAGWYKTDPANPSAIQARVRVGWAANYLQSDGRTTTSGLIGFALANTYGDRRRFFFDFVAPGDSAALEVAAFAWATGGATAIGVWFDNLTVRRIHRWELYESRLALDSLPTIDQRRGDAYFGPVARGAGTLSIINGASDGGAYFEAPFAGLDWPGQEVEVCVGGRFVGGEEIAREDWWRFAVGRIGAPPKVSDLVVEVPLEDIQAVHGVMLPPNKYGAETYPSILDSDSGRCRPMIFGTVAGMKPACVDTAGDYGYGIHSCIDAADAPNGYSDAGHVYSYLDEKAAENADASRRDTWLMTWLQTGLSWHSGLCPKVFEVTVDQNVFQFNVGGPALTCSIAAGVYQMGGGTTGLLGALSAAINAVVGDGSTALSMDNGTKKITISRPAGTFQILVKSGDLNHRGIYGLLGFKATADYTGALSYTGEDPVYTDVKELVLRVSTVTGYQDTTDGYYTGAYPGPIKKAPDIVKALLVRWCGVSKDRIDEASFAAGRAGSPDLAVLIGNDAEGVQEFSAILERIENSVGYELVLEGGIFYWRARDPSGSPTVPADVIDLTERDYLERPVGYYDPADTFDIVRVGYNQDPASGKWKTTQQTSAAVRLRFNRNEQHTFFTYLPLLADAQARLASFAAEASSKRRRFPVVVKGALLRAGLGRKVRLYRAKGLDASGALNGVLCRIVAKRDNPVTWLSEAELIEVV
jgi:hypothetical protein